MSQPRPEDAASTSPRVSLGELVGRSPAMRALFAEGARVAPLTTPVLLSGESGTGKHLLARTLHALGTRSAAPFVVVDCSRAAGGLAEDLFGRAEGRAGALELASGGSLLLDEPADLPLVLQTRLLEALSTRLLTREAGGAALPRDALLARQGARFDVRLLSSSARKLTAEVDRGKLLAPLAELLASDELRLPALRERREDVPLLAQTLLSRMPEGVGADLSSEALHVLSLHDWPGNVRELRNLLERFAFALHSGQPAARKLAAMLRHGELAALPGAPDPSLARLERRSTAGEGAPFEPGLSYREQRARFEGSFERSFVSWLLDRHDGNLSAAARAAEMDRKYLYKLAKKHGLKSGD